MKGVYELKPPIPKYSVIWDVNIVLNYLKLLGPNERLTLFCLSHKLLMLLALTTGQRAQTLHKVDIRNINIAQNLIVIPITELVKQSTPNKTNKFALHLNSYQECPDICVVKALKEYLDRTKLLRGTGTKLFISTIKPHNPISKDTVSRWLKTVLFEAGVKTEIFTAHSTRIAKASKDYYNGVTIQDILQQVGGAITKPSRDFITRSSSWNLVVEPDYGFKVSHIRHYFPQLKMKPEDEGESVVMRDSPVS